MGLTLNTLGSCLNPGPGSPTSASTSEKDPPFPAPRHGANSLWNPPSPQLKARPQSPPSAQLGHHPCPTPSPQTHLFSPPPSPHPVLPKPSGYRTLLCFLQLRPARRPGPSPAKGLPQPPGSTCRGSSSPPPRTPRADSPTRLRLPRPSPRVRAPKTPRKPSPRGPPPIHLGKSRAARCSWASGGSRRTS